MESVEDGIKVLAEVDGNIVGVEYGKQMGFAFHPELDGDLRIHQRFVDKNLIDWPIVGYKYMIKHK